MGDAGANRLDGGAGYDELDGRAGPDYLFGGPDGALCLKAVAAESCQRLQVATSGASVVRASNIDGTATLSVSGAAGADDIAVSYDGSGYLISNRAGFPAGHAQGCDSSGGSEVVRCPDGVDLVTIATEAGADTVSVDASVPTNIQLRIDGGAGPDNLYGGPGNDVIEAGDDRDPDLLDGRAGDDALIGARTDFHVPVESGRSVMVGGAGSDVLVGGDPCDGDLYDGGGGSDNANFFRFTPGVTARIGGRVTRGGNAECTPGRLLPSIEALEGSPGPDTLQGDNGRNSLSGGGGNDRLSGGGGPDRLVGGRGADRLIGGPGRDSTHQ